jgi:formate/nitrite transporter FocA (FNT family)
MTAAKDHQHKSKKSGSKTSAEKDSEDSGSALESEERMAAGSGPTPPEAWVIHEIIREDGEHEIRRSVSSLAWSGFAAGLSMGFSFLVESLLRARLPDAPWAHLITAFGYTTGFLIAVLGRQQLFTESTLTATLPFLTRRTRAAFIAMLRLWGVVLALNLLGTLAFALLLSIHGLFDPSVTKALSDTASDALRDGFLAMMVKAVLSGWLIALMVWLLPGAGPSRLFLIIILTYAVALGQFSHMIAGSVEAFFAVINGTATMGDYALRFALPTFLGNTIGGVSLVAVLNHAPVREEIPAGKN